MALPSSGVIKFSNIATEFVDSTPYKFSKYYKGGALVPNASQNTNVPTSGAIKLSNFYGAVRRIAVTVTIASNTTNYTLNTAAVPGYIAGITDVTFVVNSGVYLYSTSTATPALTVSAFTSGDTITITNNGYIMGMGGNGASYAQRGNPAYGAGQVGGPAISLGYSVKVTNNSYIGGGGGGGGGSVPGGGGGAGGGTGGGGATGWTTGGLGGGPGAVGSNSSAPGSGGGTTNYNAGGGGRIFPGTGGARGQGGGAGGGSGYDNSQVSGVSGGSAGNAGTSGSGGGGGGWGASGGSCPSNFAGYVGGAGGKAIALNGYTVTYLTTGTVYGVVS